jgi:hypothetical protein
MPQVQTRGPAGCLGSKAVNLRRSWQAEEVLDQWRLIPESRAQHSRVTEPASQPHFSIPPFLPRCGFSVTLAVPKPRNSLCRPDWPPLRSCLCLLSASVNGQSHHCPPVILKHLHASQIPLHNREMARGLHRSRRLPPSPMIYRMKEKTDPSYLHLGTMRVYAHMNT